MKSLRTVSWFAAVAVALAVPAVAAAQHGGGPLTDEQAIASAMRAAPKAVAEGAKVIGFDAQGAVRVLREGSNGFTCLGDNPATPGPDPMCGDANAMEWINAWIAHQPPPPGKIGFVYMLDGGTDASNTDPYATAPAADNHWVQTGPHVMIVGGAGMMPGYPRNADPDTTKPYVMWAGTQYEHLMIPVH